MMVEGPFLLTSICIITILGPSSEIGLIYGMRLFLKQTGMDGNKSRIWPNSGDQRTKNIRLIGGQRDKEKFGW